MTKETYPFFSRERSDPLLLIQELAIFFVTVVAIPYWCVLPLSGEPNAPTLLVQKILPCLLFCNFALSSIWDAREGYIFPYFFTTSLVIFGISCIVQASQITGTSIFFATIIEDVNVGRALCLSQILIGYLVCIGLCALVGFLEEKLDRDLCGAGDIKCIVAFFFLPMQPDKICEGLIAGHLLLLAVSIYAWIKNGRKVPVRGLPWIYAGAVPALLYVY